jgi:hypothetical protein
MDNWKLNEKIERAYWAFDRLYRQEPKKTGLSRSERDAFKMAVREFFVTSCGQKIEQSSDVRPAFSNFMSQESLEQMQKCTDEFRNSDAARILYDNLEDLYSNSESLEIILSVQDVARLTELARNQIKGEIEMHHLGDDAKKVAHELFQESDPPNRHTHIARELKALF